MSNKFFNYNEKKGNTLLIFLLLINFALRLIIYYNTTLFYTGDWGAYLDRMEQINKGIYPPLQEGFATNLNSYIGYFFKYILGNIDFYYIFSCLMGTLATFLVYKVMRSLGVSKKAGIFAVIMLTLYTEFMVFSSIFYTVIIMVLILLLVIFLSIKLMKETKLFSSLIYIFLIVILVTLSLLFKRELIYFWGIPLIISLFILRKNARLALKLIFLSAFLFFSTLITKKIILKDNITLANQPFLFFEAHTWFGGDGGKSEIIYPEKKQEYQREYDKYCKINNIVNPTRLDEIEFRNVYLKNFILKHPLSWINLQLHKFFWEYGILPEANSFKILMTGLTHKLTILTAAIVVFPIVLIITLLILSFNFSALCSVAKVRIEIKFLLLLFLYYIIATVFYFCYSERYRIPVMVSFIIPLLAVYLSEFKIRNLIRNKKELFIKLFVLLIFIANWSYEAYVITYKNRSRYIKTLDAVKQYDPSNPILK